MSTTQRQFIFRRNPFHHITLDFRIEIKRTGPEEIAELERHGHHVSQLAKSMFRNRSYDELHVLDPGVARVVFVPSAQLILERDDSDSVYEQMNRRHGYQKPRAGVAPYVRRSLQNQHARHLGGSFITVPHDSIVDRDRCCAVFSLCCVGQGNGSIRSGGFSDFVRDLRKGEILVFEVPIE